MYPETQNIFNTQMDKTIRSPFTAIGEYGQAVDIEKVFNLKHTVKRGIDFLSSVVFGIIALPLLMILSLIVLIDSPGPIFFRQERIGLKGKIFTIYKFRTMNQSSKEDDHKEYIRHLFQENEENYEQKNNAELIEKYMRYLENRTTRIGKLLRATSLDELPQLYNIFRGDMSLVGPRPHPIYEVKEYKDWYLRRLEVKPGLTGWSKLKLRLTPENYEESILFDLWYVDNWSMFLDLKIIILTVPRVLLRQDAH